MRLYDSLVRPLAFLLDPETAHNLALAFISRGLVKTRPVSDNRLRQRLLDIDFPNPLGLAAGFDKNAVAVNRWHGMGFGFAELGTITRFSQPGNPKPRLFRVPEFKALVNRMGFNNDGAAAIAQRLARATPQLPIGINLGKSKVTALEEAADDYRESFRLLRSYGAYFVINVSSPNTPGLRTLQERGPLTEIIEAVRSIDDRVRLFVKVSPDLSFTALDEIIDVAHQTPLSGLIATNTTTAFDGLAGDRVAGTGGLSGAPLAEKSNQILAHLANSCDPSITLIGVGGIFSGRDLYDKIALGAHLCQIYTGWVYGGPSAIPRILQELLTLMSQSGKPTLAALRKSA